MASNAVRVLVWDENPGHAPKEVYPENIRGAIAGGLNELGKGQIEAVAVHLDQPNQGITADALAGADVLIWWGHARHGEVNDSVADLVKEAVHERGLGFIALHSAHYSKTFRKVVGAPGHLKGGWRENNPADTEEITVCAPKHPIAAGVKDFELHEEEMYGAPFEVPPPQVVLFQSYFPLGGEYFPSFALTVGKGIDPAFTSGGGKGANQGEGVGRVFYFRPGHETYPTYFDPNVRKIIHNAALWCANRS